MLWAVWTGIHAFHDHNGADQAAAGTTSAPSAIPASSVTPAVSTTPVSPSAAVNAQQDPVAAPLPTVLHQENPNISSSARQTIRGVIKIAVRVNLDGSGNVIAATLASHASSQYFARAVLEAAKKWKFSPGAAQASQAWLLHFELTHTGAAAHSTAMR